MLSFIGIYRDYSFVGLSKIHHGFLHRTTYNFKLKFDESRNGTDKSKMKLDPTVLRTMGPTDFRVLEAVEKGMLKHALVPSSLIASLSSLRHGGTNKILSSLLRDKLLSHDQSCGYDGYRITTGKIAIFLCRYDF